MIDPATIDGHMRRWLRCCAPILAALAVLTLLALTGCQSVVSVGGKDVPVHYVYPQTWSLERRETRLLQKEIERAEALDGAKYKYPPTEIIHWGGRQKLPFLWIPGHWFVGYWWAQDGESVVHVNSVDVLRHELHHARSGPGHDGPKWEEIEAERFGD